ncbi:MAG: hypothetical protein HC875_31135 [Anaerolineales bacterium]|nr:hypothetical protein [Anaerolineales bacterium]
MGRGHKIDPAGGGVRDGEAIGQYRVAQAAGGFVFVEVVAVQDRHKNLLAAQRLQQQNISRGQTLAFFQRFSTVRAGVIMEQNMSNGLL